MPAYTDQLLHTIHLPSTPTRIVSVVPSQTELLYSLGLDKEVVGITKFCVHPEEWFRTKTRVGGTKQVNLEKIKNVNPHLIIANKEENVKEQIEALSALFPVWTSDVTTLADALEMIKAIGEMTGKEAKALSIANEISARFHQLHHTLSGSPIRVCYFIWEQPYITVGGDTFISHMLQTAGFDNVFKDEKRYPTITLDNVAEKNCDAILLSSEPYPFTQKHKQAIESILKSGKVILVDGELFSWYGSRLLLAPAYFAQLRRQIAGVS